jgi:outer membrane receptor protein involved in Fe transport
VAKAILRWQLHYFDKTNRYDDVTKRNNPNIVAAKYLQYDAQLTQDAYASYQFNDQFAMFVGVDNLTNQKPDLGERFCPVSPLGRDYFAGISWSP